MNMHWIDWTVVFSVIAFFTWLAYSTRKYAQSTSDFLAANRAAGRYLLTLAEGVAGLGAVSIIAAFQLNNHRLKSVESKVGLKVLTPAKAG
jgi:SSS family solute:Na+ symporter